MSLPPLDSVFFIHYQCDNFDVGNKIKGLYLRSKGNTEEFFEDEVSDIRSYANKVKELIGEGLIPVHWNQDRPTFGAKHINERYKELTGEELGLEYNNGINLAEYLVLKYNDSYIQHPRLDNLAKMNGFSGIRDCELGQRTFGTSRFHLLEKIYFGELKGTLKTEYKPALNLLSPQLKDKKVYRSSHYVLAYLFECHAIGKSLPRGRKKELERIGNELMGAGKGNTFYKNFNNISRLDINVEKNLFDIGGENWRSAVLELSKAPELVENFLKSKHL
jgi:hypothetical protein